MLLALLKNHSSRVYYLVSLNLKQDELSASVRELVQTRINAEGYEVCCQQVDGQIYFGFLNRRRSDKTGNGMRKMPSDIKLFCEQLSAGRRTSSDDSELETDCTPTVFYTDFAEDTCMVEDNILASESVLLQVSCSASGHIEQKIHLIGRLPPTVISKIRVQFRRNGRYVNNRNAFMTKLPLTSLSIPFIYNGEAYFIDKVDPRQIFVMQIITESGMISAFQQRLRTISGRYCKKSMVKNLDGLFTSHMFSSISAIWSGILVNESHAYVFIQEKTTWLCSLWVLMLDSSESAKGMSHKMEEDRATINVCISSEMEHRSIVRLNSDSQVEAYLDSSTYNNRVTTPGSLSVHEGMEGAVGSRSLRWINVINDLKIPDFRLQENSSLRIDKVYNRLCVKGCICDQQKKPSKHCFLTIPMYNTYKPPESSCGLSTYL